MNKNLMSNVNCKSQKNNKKVLKPKVLESDFNDNENEDKDKKNAIECNEKMLSKNDNMVTLLLIQL